MIGASLDQDWRICIRQQPRQCKVCSVSKSGLHDRRWIEQIPILQIIDNNELQRSSLSDGFLFICATIHRYPLSSSDIDDINQDILVGTKQTSIQKLEDKDGRYGWFFIFPDLSVTQIGDFYLNFHLYQLKGTLRGSSAFWLCSVASQKFTVYSRRDYPGPLSATQLSRVFRKQGIRVRLSKKTLSSSDQSDSQSESTRKEHHKKKRRKEMRLQRSVSSLSRGATDVWEDNSLKCADREEFPSNWISSSLSQASIDSERQQSTSLEREEDSLGAKSEEHSSDNRVAKSESKSLHGRSHTDLVSSSSPQIGRSNMNSNQPSKARDMYLSAPDHSSGASSLRYSNEETSPNYASQSSRSGASYGSDLRGRQPMRAHVSPDHHANVLAERSYLISAANMKSGDFLIPGRPMSAPVRNKHQEGQVKDEHPLMQVTFPEHSINRGSKSVGNNRSEFDIHSQRAVSEGRSLRPLEAHLSSAAALTTIDEAQMKSLSVGAREFLRK